MKLVHFATSTPSPRCGIPLDLRVVQSPLLGDVTCSECLNKVAHDLLVQARRVGKVADAAQELYEERKGE